MDKNKHWNEMTSPSEDYALCEENKLLGERKCIDIFITLESK